MVPHAVGCKSRMAGSCPCRSSWSLWIRLSSRRRYASQDETGITITSVSLQDLLAIWGHLKITFQIYNSKSKHISFKEHLKNIRKSFAMQLNMVIHESLRLYPPVAVVSREAFKEMKFGGITVPKGVNVWTMVLTLHTDPEVWGPDAYRFNPDRFAKGITGACKLPHLYMPFGVGPRMCLGQNLAIAELKILIALILSQFSLSLSPKYIHSPALRLVIEPERGVDLLIKTLWSANLYKQWESASSCFNFQEKLYIWWVLLQFYLFTLLVSHSFALGTWCICLLSMMNNIYLSILLQRTVLPLIIVINHAA